MPNIEESLSALGNFVQVLDAHQSGAVLLIIILILALFAVLGRKK